MRRFSVAEVLRFLQAVDSHLAAPARLRIIGSTVPMLWANQILIYSGDIDVAFVEGSQFEAACEAARQELGLEIPVQRYDAFDAPYSYEDRLEPAPAPLVFKNLELTLPERHDGALMKTARGEQRNLDLIEKVHQPRPFELETLKERYLEMQYIGRPSA